MYSRKSLNSLARLSRITASAGSNPRSANTLPLDSVIVALIIYLQSAGIASGQALCLHVSFSETSSERNAGHTLRRLTWLRTKLATHPRCVFESLLLRRQQHSLSSSPLVRVRVGPRRVRIQPASEPRLGNCEDHPGSNQRTVRVSLKGLYKQLDAAAKAGCEIEKSEQALQRLITSSAACSLLGGAHLPES